MEIMTAKDKPSHEVLRFWTRPIIFRSIEQQDTLSEISTGRWRQLVAGVLGSNSLPAVTSRQLANLVHSCWRHGF